MSEDTEASNPKEELADSSLEDIAEELIEYEDVYLENSKEIEIALENNMKKGDDLLPPSDLNDKLSLVLSSEGLENEELFSRVQVLVSILAIYTANVQRELRKLDVSDELLDLLSELAVKHGDDIMRMGYRNEQGKNWWSNLDTDVVIRGNTIGFNHEIMLDQTERINITTDMSSSLLLASHLISENLRVLEEYGESSVSQIQSEAINNLTTNYKRLIRKYTQHAENIEQETQQQ